MRAQPNVTTIVPQSEKRTRGDRDPRTSPHAFRRHHDPVNRLTRESAEFGAEADEGDAFRSETPTLVDAVELEAARLASMKGSMPPPPEEEIEVVWAPESELLDPEQLFAKYVKLLGAFTRMPLVTVPFEELPSLSMDNRMGFLIALIDGTSSIQTLLDVAGMPPREVLHALVTLRDLGIVELRGA
jgi:hypothetical protein